MLWVYLTDLLKAHMPGRDDIALGLSTCARAAPRVSHCQLSGPLDSLSPMRVRSR
jgi:hypothetical protein